MNQELVFRRRRITKILISLCATTLVVAVIGNIIRSRSQIHERWEQSVEKMEQSDHELVEKLHREEAAAREERTTQSSPVEKRDTVSQ